MNTRELYDIYSRQQMENTVFAGVLGNGHNDSLEHSDIGHQDYYTDEPDSSPGW